MYSILQLEYQVISRILNKKKSTIKNEIKNYFSEVLVHSLRLAVDSVAKPAFLALVGVSDAPDGLRISLVVPSPPDGFRLLWPVEVFAVLVLGVDVFCLNVGILLVE